MCILVNIFQITNDWYYKIMIYKMIESEQEIYQWILV